MATKKRTIKHTTKKHEAELKDTMQTLKKKEFWIGLATLAAFIFVVFKVVFPQVNLMTQKTQDAPTPVVTKASASVTPTVTVSVTKKVTTAPSPTKGAMAKKQENKEKLKKVSTLADTNGMYIVEKNDSYYTISVKACGTGIYFESIQYQNGNKSLYEGDSVAVVCTE